MPVVGIKNGEAYGHEIRQRVPVMLENKQSYNLVVQNSW